MNLSGESVRAVVDYYRLNPTTDIMVVYDDASMEPAKIRSRSEGSAGGHNGIKSIISHVGDTFARVKIGIGADPRIPLESWVLARFTAEELTQLEDGVFADVQGRIGTWLRGS